MAATCLTFRIFSSARGGSEAGLVWHLDAAATGVGSTIQEQARLEKSELPSCFRGGCASLPLAVTLSDYENLPLC